MEYALVVQIENAFEQLLHDALDVSLLQLDVPVEDAVEVVLHEFEDQVDRPAVSVLSVRYLGNANAITLRSDDLVESDDVGVVQAFQDLDFADRSDRELYWVKGCSTPSFSLSILMRFKAKYSLESRSLALYTCLQR